MSFRSQVVSTLRNFEHFRYFDGQLQCDMCTNFGSSNNCISINSSVKSNAERHNDSKTHRDAYYYFNNLGKNKNFYSNYIEKEISKINLMTECIFYTKKIFIHLNLPKFNLFIRFM